jgi:hypothetical protein
MENNYKPRVINIYELYAEYTMQTTNNRIPFKDFLKIMHIFQDAAAMD